MPSFDYITSADFRASIESDYGEMARCAEVGAWKSAQVLAGSIVEALLVDYLLSISPQLNSIDPLKLDLADAIAACKANGAVSNRTADLCSVIRSYRNLIHPGRMIRLGEPPPNKSTCDVATALIDLIVDDISKSRRATVGLTAEQVLSKILRDPGCLTILNHLLVEVAEAQRQRLLLKLLPDAYFEAVALGDPQDPDPDRLADAFRITLDSVDENVKKRVAREFVRVLKEDDGRRVEDYRKAFFRARDLEHVPEESRALVKEHLLGAAGSTHTFATLSIVEGIGQCLDESDRTKWADPFIRTLVSPTASDRLKKRCRDQFLQTLYATSMEFDGRLIGRLEDWVTHYEKQGDASFAAVVRDLQSDVRALSTP